MANETGEKIGGKVKQGINAGVDDVIAKHGPEAKKQARNLVLGLGGVTFAGSYLGTKAGNRKIKESDTMLFSFAIGINSALREKASNHLVQESIGGAIKKLLGMSDKAAAIARIKGGGGLSTNKLGKAMHTNPKAMEQAFRIYGPKSKTIKKAMPAAFGKV